MAYTLQQLADLEAAIADGVLKVVSNGREVTYRSLRDMRSLRDEMRQELGETGAGRQRRYASFKRD
jgi:hypothetical protein